MMDKDPDWDPFWRGLICGAASTCFVCFIVLNSITAKQHADVQRVGQSTYNYGRMVGYTVGMCDATVKVAQANPDSDWAKNPTVVQALQSCKPPLLLKHGPGTTEDVMIK
jgi:hypothetical protein